MKHDLQFLQKAGELKHIQRQGVLYYGFKEADSATDHVFRLALMIWIFGKRRKLNIAKAFKLALVHDLCKVYTGDITPYDGLLPKNGKNRFKLAWRWRRLSLAEKKKRYKEKFQKEKRALQKLTGELPQDVRKDIMAVWLEYQKVESPEAKFVFQLDRMENLLEAFECWERDKNFPTLPWWEHADEVVYDPNLIELLEKISKAELSQSKSRKKK
ncbi:MAG: HD domain-containing protein [Parcubacteria group bacterium]|nr:HD domain-containing protein [Parcubacteria group bacterium]